MAITPLTAPWKMFTFDGVTSGSLGVAILGDGAFNAPERDVEMVAIPGRNGDFILDKGRYMNIEVTYPCTLVADSVADFPQAMADLRSLLCSKTTYCRLEDDYNTNEYRMAMYKSGLEVDPMVLKAGTFDITFECKPQRFLKSGETAVSVTSGDDVTNPTPFPARPMLEVYGYGDINIGGSVISIQDTTLGDVQLSEEFSSDTRQYTSANLNLLNAGDEFYISGAYKLVKYTVSQYASYVVDAIRVTSTSNCTAYPTGKSGELKIVVDDMTCEKGTDLSVVSTAIYEVDIKHKSTHNITTTTVTATITTSYTSQISRITVDSTSFSPSVPKTSRSTSVVIPAIFGYSTKQATGNPLYIDLDLGEAYNTDYGTVVSSNNAVSLPAVLPTLPSGDTEITYDNTITQLDIVPRWWRV